MSLIARIDHLVLTVKNLNTTIQFYSNLFQMKHREFASNRHALYFGQQKINLHLVGYPVDKNVKHATSGSADLCLLLSGDLGDFIDRCEVLKVPIIEGPCQRSGAIFPIESVYLYDPDENLLEVAQLLDSDQKNAR